MEQARRIHDRLAGVPPTEQVLLDMTDDINGVGGRTEVDAAFRAMDNPGFYNATLKNWIAPWTNRDMDLFVPLNDYTATVIGMIRDDVPFNTLLSANILYVGAGGLGLPAYSMTDNNHYEQMDTQGVDLQADLVQVAQTDVTDIPLAGVAGIVTTRAAAEAFFVAGTNRAMFRFTMLNHLCNDMEQVKDITRVPDRIRQDVSRSPGGDSRIFLNNCIGCHTGMDPLAGAFAYYDFDETTQRIMYTPGQVQPKYFNNDDNFRPGFVTQDDSWANYWRAGQNELLGWDTGLPSSGFGAASMGAELANSQAFAQCQMKKVFKAVCLREPVDQPDRTQVDTMVTSFRNGNAYNMKQSFAEAAVYCKGP
ncbi:MAG: hypothetical protein ACR2QV_01915 [Gammaproteobacteria bacterium]